MVRTGRPLIAAVVLLALVGEQAYGQLPDHLPERLPIPAPFPVPGASEPAAPAPDDLLVPRWKTGAPPAALPPAAASLPAGTILPVGAVLPSPAGGHQVSGAYEDRNGPLLMGDPRLEGPLNAPPGWFAAVEVDPVGPHIKNHLTAGVPAAGGSTDQVHLPTANLDWTAAPRFEVGYRLGEGAGDFLASYRFLETSGSGRIANFDPFGFPGALHSRLDLNVFDLDYANHEFSLGPHWDMKWLVGVRIASIFFDSSASSGEFGQHTSDYFAGAGPHVGLELWHTLGVSGLSLFGRVDGALLIGQIHQSFTESMLESDGTQAVGGTEVRQFQSLPVVNVEAGVGWTVPGSEHLRFAGGYLFEGWYNVGHAGDSRAQLTTQGLFLRAEWKY